MGRAARRVGRYELHDPIGRGGMATVHLGRAVGAVGFSRTVAVKRLHAHLTGESELVALFIDEARLASRIQHANVVSTLDVVAADRELFLVMEYVPGVSVAQLAALVSARGERVPARVAAAIVAGALHGLHAAHEARDDRGQPLAIVHRDVSPQNILIGADGVARVFDFGVAKAMSRLQSTRTKALRGKLAYMAPERFSDGAITRQVDVYAAAAVLWELLTGKRLVVGDDDGAIAEQILLGAARPPSRVAPDLPAALDDIVLCGLARDARHRFETAREMALALEERADPATASEVGAWVADVAASHLVANAERVRAMEAALPERMAHLPTLLAEIGASPRGEGESAAPRAAGAHASPKHRRALRYAVTAVVALGLGLAAGSRSLMTHAVVMPNPPAVAACTSEPLATSSPAAGGHVASAVPVLAETILAKPASSTARAAAREGSPRLPVAVKSPAPSRNAKLVSTIVAADCDPPYVRGADGLRHWKRECL